MTSDDTKRLQILELRCNVLAILVGELANSRPLDENGNCGHCRVVVCPPTCLRLRAEVAYCSYQRLAASEDRDALVAALAYTELDGLAQAAPGGQVAICDVQRVLRRYGVNAGEAATALASLAAAGHIMTLPVGVVPTTHVVVRQ